ncbi:MAG: flagellar basal body protein FliL [Alphaproteobacteria bacterium]|nr:MAG: flagellar basal body protein FliL [Alphaproteobacteria bacterium]
MAETKKAKKDAEKPAAAKPELKAVDKDVLPSADDLPAQEGAPAEGGGISRKKLALFIALPILVVLGAGAGLYFTGHLGSFGAKKIDCATVTEGDKDYAACAQELAQASASLPPGIFVDIPAMIVNLSGNARKTTYLKIVLKIELEGKDDAKGFNAIMPRVVDQFQTYLRELRIDDLKGSSGIYRMKIELLSRVRAAAPEIKVRDVLFQEILVQQ